MLAPGMSGVLAGSGGGLEEAVVRTALALVIGEAIQARERPEPAQLVRRFLATAVHLRLALDLGEPLEAAAGSGSWLRDGLDRIKALIEADAATLAAASEIPETHRSLAGPGGLDLGHGNYGGPVWKSISGEVPERSNRPRMVFLYNWVGNDGDSRPESPSPTWWSGLRG